MLESKLKFGPVFGIILCLFLIIALIYVILAYGIFSMPLYFSFTIILFLLFFLVWLLFGELRNKAVKIKIEREFLSLRKFMGLGKESKYYFKQFDGYKTLILTNEFEDYEYLYLIIDGRREIKLSQFYHSNYSEIKLILGSKTRNLGIINFSFVTEIKEIFK